MKKNYKCVLKSDLWLISSRLLIEEHAETALEGSNMENIDGFEIFESNVKREHDVIAHESRFPQETSSMSVLILRHLLGAYVCYLIWILPSKVTFVEFVHLKNIYKFPVYWTELNQNGTESLLIMTLLTSHNINRVIFRFIELNWIKTELNHSESWLYWLHATLTLLFSGLLN